MVEIVLYWLGDVACMYVWVKWMRWGNGRVQSRLHEDEAINERGGNGISDVLTINSPGYVGQIKTAKVLGGLALNDVSTYIHTYIHTYVLQRKHPPSKDHRHTIPPSPQKYRAKRTNQRPQGNETDWKVLAIDINDPLTPWINSLADLERYRPGVLQAHYNWFTYYKVARGDGILAIVGNAYQNASYMQATIAESHGYWKELVQGEVDSNKINYNQTSQPGVSGSYVDPDKAQKEFDIPKRSHPKMPADIPKEFLEWVYLDHEYNMVYVPGTEPADD